MLNFVLGGGPVARHLSIILLVVLTGSWGVAATGQTIGAKVIENDRGGSVGARISEIAHLNALRTRVELRGRICESSCTMYLGADHVCVSPTTTFGFHGPTRNGQALPADQFEYWTDVMGAYYNTPLRRWFMDKARHRIVGVHQIRGTQLIALGYDPC